MLTNKINNETDQGSVVILDQDARKYSILLAEYLTIFKVNLC